MELPIKVSDDPSPANSILKGIWETIFKRRPILGEIIGKHGHKNLFDYTQDFLDVNPNPALEPRRVELITIVKDLLTARLGAKVGEEVAEQLTRFPLVSTADHHGFVTHPFFLNSNIIGAIPQITRPEHNLKYLVDFSFANVSLNNSSYPRGLVVHADPNKADSFMTIPIIPAKLKMCAVYGTRGFAIEDIERSYAFVDEKIKEGILSTERGEKIKEVIRECLGFEEALRAPDLSSQITEVNYRLWPKYFHSKNPVPDLIYLEIETIVTEVLYNHVLDNAEHLLHKFIFNPDCRQLIRKYFNNISGAFSIEKNWGTFLFWCLDDKNHKVRLFLDAERNVLTSEMGRHVFPFTPEEIKAALKRKEIFPSMLTCYLIVSLYYGFKCLGGFSQVNDLTLTKEAWKNMLKDMGLADEAEALGPIQTKELGGDGMTLAYLTMENGAMVPATGIDLLIREGDVDIQHFLEISKRFSLEEIMNPLTPEIYKVLFAESERLPEFSALTPEQIMESTGMNETLRKIG